ncbi:lipoprotein signal peptidase [Leptospira harrisiae]|uniref:Lipoprotein signal peptidase n=1 Tax=Leptospira harrisiae TaxID=2023189 RepID=A0A2N0AP03_9LEPT|nr:lipoprotein signal peptidase [Leptospira harrisiae]PJZ86042.1 lipoprotein signal peptidase [Leptospira harrisiae]PKA09604.1 lipoprotein signal peptidase [Leptospira harrisiae]
MNLPKTPFFSVFKPGYLAFVLVGLFLDLLSKYIIITKMVAHESIPVLGDFFRLSLTFNTGFVFGLFQDNALPSLFATGFAIVFLIFYRWQNADLGNAWGWNFVMAGAFGNFLDKFFVKIPGVGFRFGFTPEKPGIEFIGVVDFLDFEWPNFLLFDRWPAFNVADSCVSIGIVILLFTMDWKELDKK